VGVYWDFSSHQLAYGNRMSQYQTYKFNAPFCRIEDDTGHHVTVINGAILTSGHPVDLYKRIISPIEVNRIIRLMIKLNGIL
jgi:hypothetical protein